MLTPKDYRRAGRMGVWMLLIVAALYGGYRGLSCAIADNARGLERQGCQAEAAERYNREQIVALIRETIVKPGVPRSPDPRYMLVIALEGKETLVAEPLGPRVFRLVVLHDGAVRGELVRVDYSQRVVQVTVPDRPPHNWKVGGR